MALQGARHRSGQERGRRVAPGIDVRRQGWLVRLPEPDEYTPGQPHGSSKKPVQPPGPASRGAPETRRQAPARLRVPRRRLRRPRVGAAPAPQVLVPAIRRHGPSAGGRPAGRTLRGLEDRKRGADGGHARVGAGLRAELRGAVAQDLGRLAKLRDRPEEQGARERAWTPAARTRFA